MKDFNRTIAIDPNDHFAYGGRGRVWLAKKDFDKAIRDYNQAIRLYPESAPNYSGRGDVWLAVGKYDQAIRDYDTAVRLDPAMAQIVDQNRRLAVLRNNLRRR
jgi:tetratricopeptide (TPR) repeat protein